jgi:hypothetical protein
VVSFKKASRELEQRAAEGGAVAFRAALRKVGGESASALWRPRTCASTNTPKNTPKNTLVKREKEAAVPPDDYPDPSGGGASNNGSNSQEGDQSSTPGIENHNDEEMKYSKGPEKQVDDEDDDNDNDNEEQAWAAGADANGMPAQWVKHGCLLPWGKAGTRWDAPHLSLARLTDEEALVDTVLNHRLGSQLG